MIDYKYRDKERDKGGRERRIEIERVCLSHKDGHVPFVRTGLYAERSSGDVSGPSRLVSQLLHKDAQVPIVRRACNVTSDNAGLA